MGSMAVEGNILIVWAPAACASGPTLHHSLGGPTAKEEAQGRVHWRPDASFPSPAASCDKPCEVQLPGKPFRD